MHVWCLWTLWHCNLKMETLLLKLVTSGGIAHRDRDFLVGKKEAPTLLQLEVGSCRCYANAGRSNGGPEWYRCIGRGRLIIWCRFVLGRELQELFLGVCFRKVSNDLGSDANVETRCAKHGAFSSEIWRFLAATSCLFKHAIYTWMFPKIGVGPQNGWFIIENPIKMGWFGGTIIFGNTHMYFFSQPLGARFLCPKSCRPARWFVYAS